MYRVLMANIPGCVAFSLPVQRRNLQSRGDFSVFPALRSQRSARLTETAVSSPSGVRSQVKSLFQGRLQTRHDRLSGPTNPICDERRTRLASRRVFSDRRSGTSCRPNYSDGPTLDAPHCVADGHRKNNNDAKHSLGTSLVFRGIPIGEAR